MGDIINYSIHGRGAPVLLLHGWAMHAGVWDGFVERLSGQYQVITVDLRGHGQSRDMAGPYTFDVFAADIDNLMRHLCVKRVALIGWSMGVSILLKLLGRNGSRVGSCVFISGNPSLVQREGYSNGVPPVTVKRLFRNVNRNYPQGLKSFHDLLFTPEELSSVEGTHAYTTITDKGRVPAKGAALESLQNLLDEDLRETLHRITVPTLIIHGREDRICVCAAAEYMHATITNSRMFLLENTGHAPFVSRKNDVFSAIEEFFSAASKKACKRTG